MQIGSILTRNRKGGLNGNDNGHIWGPLIFVSRRKSLQIICTFKITDNNVIYSKKLKKNWNFRQVYLLNVSFAPPCFELPSKRWKLTELSTSSSANPTSVLLKYKAQKKERTKAHRFLSILLFLSLPSWFLHRIDCSDSDFVFHSG